MKKTLKNLLATAILGAWAFTSYAHHISGTVLCTDTVPPTPLGLVPVTITGASGTTFSDVTALDGHFFISLPIATDTYTVTITPPAGLTIVSPASKNYVVQIFADANGGPDHFDGANFSLTGCGTPPVLGQIGDTVYCDTNGNGVQDAGEPGIPGVKVTLECKNAAGVVIATAVAITDANGHYLFVDVPAGACVVTVDATTVPASCSVPGCPLIVNKGMGAGEIFLGADFCFRPPSPNLGRIGDTVYCDANGNGTQDAGEPGIPGVKVTLVCKDASGAIIATATAVTDANGKYLFVNVPAGTCEVTVDPTTVTGDCNVPCATKVTIVLGPGESYLDADFCFTQPPAGPGTGTPGYWKNHPEAWPVSSIVIGGITYTKSQAIKLMGTAEKGDKTYTVFRHLVAAKLNLLSGTASGCIAAEVDEADAWMAIHPVGSNVSGDSAAWAEISDTATKLDDYNNGKLCAPHRD